MDEWIEKNELFYMVLVKYMPGLDSRPVEGKDEYAFTICETVNAVAPADLL